MPAPRYSVPQKSPCYALRQYFTLLTIYGDNTRSNNDITDDSTRTNPDKTNDNTPHQPLVLERLENEVEWLRREVERKDTIIMSLSRSIGALEAPSEPRESSVTPSDSSDRVETTADDTGKPRSWLRRFFDL